MTEKSTANTGDDKRDNTGNSSTDSDMPIAIKLDGEDHPMTVNEVQAQFDRWREQAKRAEAAAEKAASAEAAASEMKARLERLQGFANDVTAANRGDPSAIRKLGEYTEFGFDPKRIDATLKQQPEEDQRITIDDLDPSLKDMIERAQDASHDLHVRASAERAEQVRRDLSNKLAGDALLSELFEADPDAKAAAMDFANLALLEVAQRQWQQGNTNWDPRSSFDTIIGRTRGHLLKTGKLKKTEEGLTIPALPMGSGSRSRRSKKDTGEDKVPNARNTQEFLRYWRNTVKEQVAESE